MKKIEFIPKNWKKMSLEDFYTGDASFATFSAAFTKEWNMFADKDNLLKAIGGDLELARPIAYKLDSRCLEWLTKKLPMLDNISPIECLSTIEGKRRLKTCLMRMP